MYQLISQGSYLKINTHIWYITTKLIWAMSITKILSVHCTFLRAYVCVREVGLLFYSKSSWINIMNCRHNTKFTHIFYSISDEMTLKKKTTVMMYKYRLCLVGFVWGLSLFTLQIMCRMVCVCCMRVYSVHCTKHISYKYVLSPFHLSLRCSLTCSLIVHCIDWMCAIFISFFLSFLVFLCSPLVLLYASSSGSYCCYC